MYTVLIIFIYVITITNEPMYAIRIIVAWSECIMETVR